MKVKVEEIKMELLKTAFEINGTVKTILLICSVLLFYTVTLTTLTLLAKSLIEQIKEVIR